MSFSGQTEQRLDAAVKELRQIHERINRSTTMTAVAGAIILIALGVWFYIGSKLWNEVTEPDKLVAFAGQEFDRKLPEMRKLLEKEVAKSAPQWAKMVSERVVEDMPKAREHLEAYILDQMDESIKKTNLLAEDQIRAFLKKNKKAIAKGLNQLAASPDEPKEALEELVKIVEAEYDVHLRDELAQVLKTVKEMRANIQTMAKSKDGKDLSEDQALERRGWMIFRGIMIKNKITLSEKLQ